MNEIDERVKALLRSAVGCAFLLIVEEPGLTPREVARPTNSFYLGAFASNDVDVWQAHRDDVLQSVFYRGQKLVDLARDLLETSDTGWWFGAIDTSQQIWVSNDGAPPEPARLVTPVAAPTRSERYAQRSGGALYTSSLMQGASSLFAALDEGVTDTEDNFGVPDIGYGRPGPPYEVWRVEVHDSARIFEIDGPLAWHDLCVCYPANGNGERGTPDFSGDPGQIVPDWSAVSADWDAVHLSFGGLLTSDQVRVESSAGWSHLWGWDAEQVMWLRWVFSESYYMGGHERVHPLPRYSAT